MPAPKKRTFCKERFSDACEDPAELSLNESITQETSKEEIDAALANFFFRSGIAFRIADSPAWKSLINLLNPNYAQVMPSSKILSRRLLDKQYEESSRKVTEILEGTEGLILASDGWTNVNEID